MHAEAINFFEQAMVVPSDDSGCNYWRSEETSRGRDEIRESWSIGDLDWLPQKDDWQLDVTYSLLM